MTLGELRRRLAIRQATAAARLHMTQGAVSAFENHRNGNSHSIASLTRYLAALGCDLEVYAVTPAGRWRLDFPGGAGADPARVSALDEAETLNGAR